MTRSHWCMIPLQWHGRWKVMEKLIDETVEHFPKELSRERWGKISGNVFEKNYRLSPIPKRRIEIMLEVELKIDHEKRKTLERFRDIIENNYQNNESTGDYSIYDSAVLNLQRENFGATLELQESENEEEDHLVDDEGDDVICLDWV